MNFGGVWRLCVVVLFVLHICIFNAATTPGNFQTDGPTTQSTVSSSTTQTPISIPPDSVMAALNKIPGGIQSAILPLLISGGSLDMSSISQLMTALGPQLLQGSLQTNASQMAGSQKNCYEDIDTFLNDTIAGKMWAITMMDASGKPGSSMMKGAMKFLGNFEECLEAVSDVSKVTGRRVRGDTCVVSLNPPPEMLASLGGAPGIIGTTLAIDWHMCVPETCNARSIRNGLANSLSQMNLSMGQILCHSELKSGPVGHDPAAVCAVVLCAVLASLVLLGTMLDMNIRVTKGRQEKDGTTRHIDAAKFTEICTQLNNDVPVVETSTANGSIKDAGCKSNEHVENGTAKFVEANGSGLPYLSGTNGFLKNDKKTSEEKKPIVPLWQRLLLCFSAVSNGEKILSVKTSPGSLTCLNGVRVLSMGWVILGHTFTFMLQIADVPANMQNMTQNLFFQVIINGTLSVDSFFVLSGLLVTYLFLRETEKSGGVTVKQMILYYVHRYWRLTPAYAFMIFMSTCLVRYMGDGPTWQGPFDRGFCEDHWWLNLLYVNNLARVQYQCYGVGWYLANDMQFYIVAPLALIPLALSVRRGKYLKMFGLCVIGCFLITSVVTTAYYMHTTNSSLFVKAEDYMFNVYFKPWCRIGTFAIGMALGYILHATKAKINIPVFLQGVCWFLALVAAGAATLSTYDENGPGRSLWDVGGRTAHETLFRPVWGLVLGWVILMCCSGKAGIIDWMLSWAWWQPLARLTYGAFLFHPLIMFTDMGTATRLLQFTTGNLVNRFFGYTCLSYIFAFLLAILVEAPLLQLEKILLGR